MVFRGSLVWVYSQHSRSTCPFQRARAILVPKRDLSGRWPYSIAEVELMPAAVRLATRPQASCYHCSRLAIH